MTNPKDIQLSEHFRLSEFISERDPDGWKIPPEKIAHLKTLCVNVLEPLRTKIGHGLRITSGYRSAAYNARVGGAKKSQHVDGTAADIACAGDDEQIDMLAIALQIQGCGGGGLYPGRNFIHLDVRPREGGKVTTWQQIGGKYKALSLGQRKALMGKGAEDF